MPVTASFGLPVTGISGSRPRRTSPSVSSTEEAAKCGRVDKFRARCYNEQEKISSLSGVMG